METMSGKIMTLFYVIKTYILFWTNKMINAIFPIKRAFVNFMLCEKNEQCYVYSNMQYEQSIFDLFIINMNYHINNLLNRNIYNDLFTKKSITLLLSSNKKQFITTIKSDSPNNFHYLLSSLEKESVKYNRLLCSPALKKIEIINNNISYDITDHVKNIIIHENSVKLNDLLNLFKLANSTELIIHKFDYDTFSVVPQVLEIKDLLDMEVNVILNQEGLIF